MESSFLILIKSNPLESHRPVEAVRIGLGLLSGEHRVQIVLMNEAPLLLSEDFEDLVDGELLPNYLPSLKELGQIFYVEEEAWKTLDLDQTEYEVSPVSMTQITEQLQEADRFMVF
jgi:hypothetical protein